MWPQKSGGGFQPPCQIHLKIKAWRLKTAASVPGMGMDLSYEKK
jgi:hypothetical protein